MKGVTQCWGYTFYFNTLLSAGFTLNQVLFIWLIYLYDDLDMYVGIFSNISEHDNFNNDGQTFPILLRVFTLNILLN